jgi:hypothetical protein
MSKRWNAKKPFATVAALTLALSPLMAPVGVALAADEPALGAVGAGVPEWAVDDGAKPVTPATSELPASFDMRTKGWVTPVKQQAPWQTCWAFGATAAVESSLLSDANNTDFDPAKLDLSERHLAWFAVHHITEAEDPAQAGEGSYPMQDGSFALDTGGNNILVTTMFSQGAGPVLEEQFPYRGIGPDGKPRLNTEAIESDPVGVTLAQYATECHVPVDQAPAMMQEAADKYGMTYDEVYNTLLEDYRKQYAASPAYSAFDDWSIPVTDANGALNRFKNAGVIIKDGNVLPTYWGGGEAPSAASMNAIKRELANGRGVYIGYKADVAQPGAARDTTYMNRDNWAQYTFTNPGMDHAVCLVGWDDDYAASNFTHDLNLLDEKGKPVVGEDGKPVIDPDSAAKTTPPGNGAWIVKNSWGSKTDETTDDLGNPTGVGDYGVSDSEGKSTGYFYLSYYDRTITTPETMRFSSNLLGQRGVTNVFQHDYMVASGGFYTETSEGVMSSANVFDLSEEVGDQTVLSIGGRTSGQNQRATFAIYQLNDGATEPTDGKLLARASGGFEYAGYHRLDLDEPLKLEAGHKYSVVSTMTSQDEGGKQTYGISANQGVSKGIREWMHTLDNFKNANLVWNQAVVNKGESFLYKDGAWVDWSDYIAALPMETDDPELQAAAKAGYVFDRRIDALPIDNFSIKIYATPAEADPEPEPDGWRRAEDKTWYYLRDGAKVTGWMQDTDGQWYHFANDGVMDTGWLKDADGQWYYLSQDHDGSFGHLVSGWVFDHGFWYYLSERHDGTFGRMLTGWQQVSGSWYYLYPQAGAPKGSCALDTVIDGYRVDASGRWVR